jgi:hypothetical protein
MASGYQRRFVYVLSHSQHIYITLKQLISQHCCIYQYTVLPHTPIFIKNHQLLHNIPAVCAADPDKQRCCSFPQNFT